jgi:hypothetical protein
VLRGGRTVSLRAPLQELPLLARAGAVIPLLSADVDTLAPYGGRGLVHLRDRRGRLSVLAFPRGRTRRTMFEGERLVSHELAGGGWRLRIAGKRRRAYTIEASLGALKRPFVPCGVAGAGVRRWSYSRRARVLRVVAVMRRGSISAAACAGTRAARAPGGRSGAGSPR